MKKSKIALAAVTAALLATTAGGLAACGGDDGKKPKGKHEYTIEFDANGGEFAEGTETPVKMKTSGGMLRAFPDDPTVAPPEHSDYTFIGWALEDDATADDALELPCSFDSDDTLYAIWGGEQEETTGAYLITFDPKGGTLAAGESTQMTVDGKLETLPTPTNGDKTFLGWYTVDGSTSESHKVTAGVTVFDRAGTVYASYSGGSVTPVTEVWVTFNGNGGKYDVDGEKQDTTSVQTESRKIKTLPAEPTRDGYEFTGYNTKTDGSGDAFTTETEVTSARLTVYAQWNEVLGDDTYTVTRDGTAQPSANLTDRTSWLKDQTDGRDQMYSIGSDEEKGIELKNGDTISFKINGEPIEFFLTPGSLGVDTTVTKTEIAEIKITADDTFVFYLAHYPAEKSTSGEACWSIDVKAAKTEAPKPLHEGSVTVLDGAETPLIDKTRELGTWSPTAKDDKDAELTVSFKPGIGKQLSFKVDGKPVSFYLEPEATGLTGETGKIISSVTTETDGTYTLYLKHYPINSQHTPARNQEEWVLAASYTGATTVTKVDGIYVGETLKTKLKPGETNQLVAEHIDFTAGDELTFIINGETIVGVSMEDNAENSKNIKVENNKLVVKETGTYTLYYKTNTKQLWVTDEGAREDSQLQEGDGLYNGDTPIKAFEVNAGGVNEIMATGVKLTAETAVTLKYGGVKITDFTLKSGSHVDQSVLSGGTLTLAANTYNFYYNYSSKELYIGIEGGTPVTTKDGLYAGENQIKAFEANAEGTNEVMATGVKLTAETAITLMYDGVKITDFTLKPDSHVEQSVLSGGTLTLAANTYNFYYNYSTKVLYIGIEGGIVVTPVTPLTKATVGSTDIEIKCIKPDAAEKDTEYAAENVTLKKGEKFQLHNGDDIPTFWLDGYDGGKTKEALSVTDASKLSSEATVIKSGIYNLYIKHYASGWTVSAVFVKAIDGETEPDPVTKKDGIYNGDTLIKEASTHNANEIKFVHVTFEAGDTFTIMYGGDTTTAKMKPSSETATNSSKIEVADGVYKVKTKGMFTMYYQHTGDVGLWVVDEAMSDLQTGDGMIATGVNAPFVINDGGTNEVMVIDVELTAKTSLELKYGGAKVTDYTVKNLSEITGATLASGVLTLPAGTYGFYYNYSTKELYVGVKVDVPAGFVATEKGNQDETHPNVYLVGKYGGLTAVTKDYGKLATYANNDYGYTTFEITVTLAVGDEIAIWVPDWNFMCATAENGNTTYLEAVKHGDETYLKVNTAGSYSFYFKSKSGDDKIYIVYPEA